MRFVVEVYLIIYMVIFLYLFGQRKKFKKDQLILISYLGIGLLFELAMSILILIGVKNVFLNNLFIIFEILLILCLLRHFSTKILEAIIIFGAGIVIFLFWLAEFSIKGIQEIFSITSFTESIIMILFGFYFLFQLTNKSEFSITKQFRFWALIGIVLFFSTYLILGSFLTVVDTKDFNPILISVLATLPVIMNFVCLMIYLKAFLCKI